MVKYTGFTGHMIIQDIKGTKMANNQIYKTNRKFRTRGRDDIVTKLLGATSEKDLRICEFYLNYDLPF